MFLAVYFLITLSSSRHLTLTYDETDHYRYGVQILEGNSDRFDDSKMPFSAINALLGKLGVLFPTGESDNPPAEIQAGRVATQLFAVLVALLVYTRSRKLYGPVPALFSLLLFIFEPNIIAHAQLITTDIYAAGMILFSIFTLWRFQPAKKLEKPGIICYSNCLGTACQIYGGFSLSALRWIDFDKRHANYLPVSGRSR